MAFIDRLLYLPQEWAWDRTRRQEAGVPEEVCFAIKPEQAMVMLLHAWEQGAPMRWVTGDFISDDSPQLRKLIQQQERYYVLTVSANLRVWTE